MSYQEECESGYFDQEQDDRDYEFGCGTELQNAYALSQMEIPLRNDQKKIDALVAQGRFVLYTSIAAYCPLTDAILGAHTVFVSDHDTEAEAREAAEPFGEDYDDYSVIVVGPRPPVVEVEALFGDDDIPF